MKERFILALAICSAVSAYSQTETTTAAEDEIPTELMEVVVTGENVWIEGNKIVFRPKKSAKNLATDAVSLIQNMNTGLLFVDNGQIKSRDGQDVTIYINGVKADGMDLSTFWPKNALRVEYMESSNDPRFAGSRNIVNFVMKEYVTGGLTKLEGSQMFPNNGDYSVSSKLVYGKMTYNAIFKGGYSRDHLNGRERTEQYEDIWYEGTHYDLVERRQRTDQVTRSDELYGGLNARYRTNKFIMTHSAGLQWNRDPESTSHGLLEYTPGIISSNSMNTLSRARSLSPALKGTYQFIPGGKWSYNFGWNFSHSHNNNFSEYSELANDAILSCVRENIYNYGLIGNIWLTINNKNYLDLTITEARTLSSAAYTGTIISDQWQHSGETTLKLRWQYVPSDPLYIIFTPQVSYSDWNVDHKVKKHSWMPGVTGTVYWSFNSKNNLSIGASYFQKSPLSSMRNDLILRETELKWIEGNPSIKPSSYETFYLSWFTAPLKWLTSNMSFDYSIYNNEPYISYRGGGTDYDGVIGQYEPGARQNMFGYFWRVAANLFGGKINISNELEYNYYEWNYAGATRSGYWHTSPMLRWNFGNCSLMVKYTSPRKWASEGGCGMTRKPAYYVANFSYGNGNLNVNVMVMEPFRKHNTEKEWYRSGPYSYNEKSWHRARCFYVSLTYTFDYGKKVEPGISISDEKIQSTSVLGSGK